MFPVVQSSRFSIPEVFRTDLSLSSAACKFAERIEIDAAIINQVCLPTMRHLGVLEKTRKTVCRRECVRKPFQRPSKYQGVPHTTDVICSFCLERSFDGCFNFFVSELFVHATFKLLEQLAVLAVDFEVRQRSVRDFKGVRTFFRDV